MNVIRAFFPKSGHFFEILKKGQGKPQTSYVPNKISNELNENVIRPDKTFSKKDFVNLIFLYVL